MEIIFKKEGPIATITINREDAYNALNRSIFEKLEDIFQLLEKDDEVMVAIITGTGQKAFVAGADVKEIKQVGHSRPAMIKKGQETLLMRWRHLSISISSRESL